MIGNFNWAIFKALIPNCIEFVSISNRIRPLFIFETQWSTFPFPLPILISSGFLLTGVSAMILIINCPAFLMTLFIHCLHVKIWFDVNFPESIAFSPTTPELKLFIEVNLLIKLKISGKISGKTRSDSIIIESGILSLNSVSADNVSVIQHVYTNQGAFGFQMSVNYK